MHYNEILSEHNIGFPLVHSEANFHHPLAYGDIVECTITVPQIGETSITWRIEFRNQEGILCWSADQVTVCVEMSDVKEKVRVPDWIREGLSKMVSN